MKRVAVVCLVGLLALAFGCGKWGELILLKALPEIDKSALDPYVDLGPGEISSDKVWVNISGTAKQDLGQGLQVDMERFTAEGRLDNVTAYLRLAKPPAPVIPDMPEPGQGGKGALFRPPILPPRPISVGDEVTMVMDGTSTKGAITKLVLKPMGAVKSRLGGR